MVHKRFPFIYSILFGFLATMMIVVMTLLFVEYRFFCNQAQEMVELKQQYAQYVDILNKKINGEDRDGAEETVEEVGDLDLDPFSFYSNGDPNWNEVEIGVEEVGVKEIMAAEASDAPDDDDEYVDDSFVVINRHPDYLKQSTLDYMQSQELNTLMTAIDIDRWSDYTGQPVVIPHSQSKKSATHNRPTSRLVNKPKETKITAMRRPIKDCGFIWPIDADKFWLSSLFGPRKRIDGTWGFHHGIDMAAVKGTIVKAARAGTVTEACFQTGYGNTVVIQHTDKIKTRYAHLHVIRVCTGQKVKQGSIVGTVGETGFIRKKGKDGSHLHFEVYEAGKRVNPMNCLPRTA
jgi:hypothetical protein